MSAIEMYSNTPEYLQQQVCEKYGIEIDLSTIYIYLDMDPYLTPDSLYLYVMDLYAD